MAYSSEARIENLLPETGASTHTRGWYLEAALNYENGPKKVAFVCRTWFPAQQALIDAAQKQLDSKHIEIVYVLLSENEAGRPSNRSASAVETRVVRGWQFNLFGKEIMLNIGLSKVLDEISPSAVVITPWSEVGCFEAKAWAIHHKVPCIGWVMGIRRYHWHWTLALRVIATIFIARKFVRGMSELFTEGWGVAERIAEVCRFPKARMVSIQRPIEDELFSFPSDEERQRSRRETRTALGVAPDTIVFGFVGQLIERKGIRHLLQTCEELWLDGLEFKLFILGRGKLQTLVDSTMARFPGMVIQRDLVPPDQLKECFAICDCILVTSLFDDWLNVINEAFHIGVPVIASTGAFATLDLVRHGENGFRYDPAHPEQLKDLIRLALAHRIELPEMGRAGQELAVHSWSLENAARIITERLVHWTEQPLVNDSR